MNTDQPVTDLIMDTSPLPPGVNITFSNITNGNPLDIQVNVEANECPSDDWNQMQNSTGPWSVHITPRGFSLSVQLHLTLECQCDCKHFTMADTNHAQKPYTTRAAQAQLLSCAAAGDRV
ncbi:integrin beta-1-like [Thalassophryne amazonica]|uniref:integrin beta-1-like n=1 Tax=Thalassophryne amazonica TaxID=390379 RepID=UPI00147248B6|nr:integrin beta-1-like [Thalassophryne amazonica]